MKGLTLSRKEGEYIQLSLPDGQTIHISVSKLQGKQVKLKVYADESVKILRSELVDN
jgi:carbon storage regulator CsrA